MDEAISHADNLWPWDCRIVDTLFRGNSACGLTNDFQQADQSQIKEAVCVKVLRVTCLELKRMPLVHDPAYDAGGCGAHAWA